MAEIEDDILEPERYELHAESAWVSDLTRRGFFKVLGGGIAVVLVLQDAWGQQDASARLGDEAIGAWLHIGEDGVVTAYTGKTEVGQNIRTSLAQIVAEELHLPVSSVKMMMADTDLTPYDRGTFGSRTTPFMGAQLRRVAAAAREMLMGLAAKTWGVDRDMLKIVDGHVRHEGTGRMAGFGVLTKGQKLVQAIAGDAPSVPAAQWQVAGTSVSKVQGRDFVTGKHRYTSDLHLPDMLCGKVLRAPAFGAVPHSVDVSRAAAMPGVTAVHEGAFAGVTAPDEQAALRALRAIRAEWQRTPQPSRAELFRDLKAQAGDMREVYATGSVEEALSGADHALAQTYTVDYIAHAPLEPRAALAQWADGRLTVWTGTQRPFGVRSELAQAFGIAEDRVRVIVPDTGSGYGGKHTGDAAIEAARLSRAAGRPVRVVWTREEEFTWAYFRPAGVIDVRGGVRKDGAVIAWDFRNYNSGTAAIRPLYDIPNQRIGFYPVRAPLRQGSYRALAAVANHFARETHMDELARLAGMDALAFRLHNLKDARLRAVFEAAAKTFGWGGRPAPGRGFGLAGGFDKGGYVATCAEVTVDQPTGKISVVRVVVAFECGAVVNPNGLKNQVEGAVVQGLGGALFESVDFADGRILNPRFATYRVPHFGDMPDIEVVVLNRKDLPSAGAGETPIVGIAPAVGNAAFDATGMRLRALPLMGVDT